MTDLVGVETNAEAKVATFYLHIFDRQRLVRDRHGYDCEDPEEAVQKAHHKIVELVSQGTWQRNSHGGRKVQITNRAGARLAEVYMWETLMRYRSLGDQ